MVAPSSGNFHLAKWGADWQLFIFGVLYKYIKQLIPYGYVKIKDAPLWNINISI